MNWYKLIKLNKLIKSHRLKLAALVGLQLLRKRHLSVKFDPATTCNLKCQMCYMSDPKWHETHSGKFTWDEIQLLAKKFFPYALYLSVGCTYEPTTYNNYIDIIKLGIQYKIPSISFATNGQLLKKEHIEKFIEIGLNELILSTHGTKKETYEKLMPPAKFNQFLYVLETLTELKIKNKFSIPKLRINYTVNPDNLKELKNFFNVFGQYNLNVLQIRPIMDFGNTKYKRKDMSEYLTAYYKNMKVIQSECKERSIMLLAFLDDPTYTKINSSAILARETGVIIDPVSIWKEDYNWREETYYEYCRRTNWKRNIIKKIFTKAVDLSKNEPALGYEIL